MTRASKCTVWAVVDVAATEYNQQKLQKQRPRTRVAQFVVCHGVHFVDHGASFFQTQAILRDLLRQTVPVRLYRCGWWKRTVVATVGVKPSVLEMRSMQYEEYC